MTPSPIVGASAHRWPMDLRTDALRNHHPRMPQYSIEELAAIANRFKKLDDELVRITDAYAYRMGVTEEQVSHEVELLKSQDG